MRKILAQLLLAVFLCGCAATVHQKDDKLVLNWSTQSKIGFGASAAALAGGWVTTGIAISEGDSDLALIGSIIGVAGFIGFVATTIAAGISTGKSADLTTNQEQLWRIEKLEKQVKELDKQLRREGILKGKIKEEDSPDEPSDTELIKRQLEKSLGCKSEKIQIKPGDDPNKYLVSACGHRFECKAVDKNIECQYLESESE